MVLFNAINSPDQKYSFCKSNASPASRSSHAAEADLATQADVNNESVPFVPPYKSVPFVPPLSSTGTCASIDSIEHARVFEPVGSQLITARSTYHAASRRRIYVRAPLPFNHQRLTVGRRPYMSQSAPPPTD